MNRERAKDLLGLMQGSACDCAECGITVAPMTENERRGLNAPTPGAVYAALYSIVHERRIPDLLASPPEPCGLRVGDRVTYTNDYGVSFTQTVVGFAKTPHLYGNEDSSDRFVYLDTGCWWVPKELSSISPLPA